MNIFKRILLIVVLTVPNPYFGGYAKDNKLLNDVLDKIPNIDSADLLESNNKLSINSNLNNLKNEESNNIEESFDIPKFVDFNNNNDNLNNYLMGGLEENTNHSMLLLPSGYQESEIELDDQILSQALNEGNDSNKISSNKNNSINATKLDSSLPATLSSNIFGSEKVTSNISTLNNNTSSGGEISIPKLNSDSVNLPSITIPEINPVSNSKSVLEKNSLLPPVVKEEEIDLSLSDIENTLNTLNSPSSDSSDMDDMDDISSLSLGGNNTLSLPIATPGNDGLSIQSLTPESLGSSSMKSMDNGMNKVNEIAVPDAINLSNKPKNKISNIKNIEQKKNKDNYGLIGFPNNSQGTRPDVSDEEFITDDDYVPVNKGSVTKGLIDRDFNDTELLDDIEEATVDNSVILPSSPWQEKDAMLSEQINPPKAFKVLPSSTYKMYNYTANNHLQKPLNNNQYNNLIFNSIKMKDTSRLYAAIKKIEEYIEFNKSSSMILRNKYGDNPIMYAIRKNCEACVNMLVYHKMNLNISLHDKDNNGKDIFDIARQYDNDSIITMLNSVDKYF